jgi:hypothetical protein
MMVSGSFQTAELLPSFGISASKREAGKTELTFEIDIRQVHEGLKYRLKSA